MKIIFWSDFACPYCYIGETRMKKAIAQLEEAGRIQPGEVQLQMKAFQLEPYAPEHAEGDTLTRFAAKYKLTDEEAAAKIDEITQMGRAEGLEFNYAAARSTNTMDAHRLTKLAQSKSYPSSGFDPLGKGNKSRDGDPDTDGGSVAAPAGDSVAAQASADPELADRVIDALFHAYLAESKELADKSVLQEIGVSCGLDPDEVKSVLDSTEFRGKVVIEEKEAARNGVRVVPFFVLEKYAVPGVVSIENYKEAIMTVKEELEMEK